MLNECKKKEYFDCVNSKGEGLLAESLFLILILINKSVCNRIFASSSGIIFLLLLS